MSQNLSAKWIWASVAAGALLATGCSDKRFGLRPSDAPSSKIIPRGSSKTDQDNSPSKVSGKLAEAHEKFRQKEYGRAQDLFSDIAGNKRNSPAVAEEARYYEAECLRLRTRLPAACDTYSRMLKDFPSGAYKEQAVQRMFDIANYWLKDTDAEMAQYKEKLEGKRSVVMPAILKVNLLDQTKPTLDAENRALQALEVVHYSDITGPLADKALFLAGYVKFYREDYKEADHYFSQLIEMHKNSSLAPQAVELAIICKSLANGGPDFDARKVAEARQLIDVALKAYPELAKNKNEFLMRSMFSINAQQATKDIHHAEFYERTGHPGSAYFMYEMVRRRYPGTRYSQHAEEQMTRLKNQMEKKKAGKSSDFDDILENISTRWNRFWGTEEKPDSSARPDRLPPAGAIPAIKSPDDRGPGNIQ
jgi:outer membrane protein assembly factor BamD (BamD/ComL family)